MINSENNGQARDSILRSIRQHLAASTTNDQIYAETKAASDHLHRHQVESRGLNQTCDSLTDLFRERLEAVEGHCILASGESEVVQALRKILFDVNGSSLKVRRVALSDSATVRGLAKHIESQIEEATVAPNAASLFGYDVGISTVQAAIAETGTLVLQSDREKHRLVSLLPPVHIAIVEAEQIFETLGEALSFLRQDGQKLSPAITFITGPSRTADIELTLAIGVHGPQVLYVIVNTGPRLSA
jgi:L-lactate dehydrogenase complex protein LldG